MLEHLNNSEQSGDRQVLQVPYTNDRADSDGGSTIVVVAEGWVGHEEKRGRSRLWSVFVVTATVSLLVAPVTMAIGEAVRGIRPWDLFAPTAAIGMIAGVRLTSRNRRGRPVVIRGRLTLSAAFASLYPLSLAIGFVTLEVTSGHFTWGRGPIFAIVVVAATVLIPAVSTVNSRWRRFALGPLTWVTTALAVLLLAAYGIGIVLTPLAFSYWLVLHPPHKYPGRAAGQLIANPNVHR